MDLPSDSDESDVDFVPEEEVEDVESENEADKETEDQYDNEVASKKRSKPANAISGHNKKAKLDTDGNGDVSKPAENNAPALNAEETKKYEDDLWASFLDTPTRSNKSSNNQNATTNALKTPSEETKEKAVSNPTKKVENVESDARKTTKINTPNIVKGQSSSTANLPGRKPVGGLASIVSKIGKKDKLSTLEKSKLDWMSFKKQEGIEEEIQTHNRGKSGYLERQDFLERTDLRQFEIEKNLRLNKRSSR